MMHTRQRLFILLTLLAVPVRAQAAEIAVTTNAVQFAVDGKCSLFEAIEAAQSDTAVDSCPAGEGGEVSDVILLEAVAYIISAPSPYSVNTGLPPIYTPLEIRGKILEQTDPNIEPEHTRIVRDTKEGTPAFRLFYINNAKRVVLENLTLKNGKEEDGGAINNTDTLLTLKQVMLKDNTATSFGGVITNYGNGKVVIESSRIRNNSAQNSGGAIRSSSIGSVTITDTILQNNTVKDAIWGMGGAVHIVSGELSITTSEFTANHAAFGGAILATGGQTAVSIGQTRLAENTARSGGALALQAGAMAFVQSSTFLQNQTAVQEGEGGAIYADGAKELNILDTALFKNTADNYGGAIYTTNGTSLKLFGSTVAQNEAGGFGGGLMLVGAPALIRNSTIVGNRTKGNISGGIENMGKQAVTMGNTVLLGNQGNVTTEKPDDSDCSGQLVSEGGNIIGATSGLGQCTITAKAGDYVGNTVDQNGQPVTKLGIADLLGTLVEKSEPGAIYYPLLDYTAGQPIAAMDTGVMDLCTATMCIETKIETDAQGNSTETCVKEIQPLLTDQIGHARSGQCDRGAIEAVCGDGIVHTVKKESCDDSNTADGDGCSATCTTEEATPADGTPKNDGDGGSGSGDDSDDSDAKDSDDSDTDTDTNADDVDTDSDSDDNQSDTPANTDEQKPAENTKPTNDKIPGIDVSAPKDLIGASNSGSGSDTTSTAASNTAPASTPTAESGGSNGCSLITNVRSQPRSRS